MVSQTIMEHLIGGWRASDERSVNGHDGILASTASEGTSCE